MSRKNKNPHPSIYRGYGKFVVVCLGLLIFSSRSLEAKTFKVASYNVENLFDLQTDGAEYPAYIPNGPQGWTPAVFQQKLDNIARVIKDLDAEVVLLQEIESRKALIKLQDRLRRQGVVYPYRDIAEGRATAVKCAILSKFPIVQKQEIRVPQSLSRNIMQVNLDIEGQDLIIFINHWNSKRNPESRRVTCAKALIREIDALEDSADFILAGDFNADYDEYRTVGKSPNLNNTRGLTGINHVLKTIKDDRLVDEKMLIRQRGNVYLYNLWLELASPQRWSLMFRGSKDSLDNMIVSKGLYDQRGISYVDNSFNSFKPAYLLKNGRPFRWQRTRGGHGRHLGQGYSDHLPIFAHFSTEPFNLESAK